MDGVPANNLASVWDSGIGVLVTWQPFDFGLRSARVAAATAARDEARATMERTRYDVSVATADAFLTMLAAAQTAQAARAAVESWRVLLTNIHALVASQLRPGADESRVEAELAAAQAQVAQAEQAIEVARSTVAQFTGLDNSQINLIPGRLLEQLPPESPQSALVVAANPVAVEQNAVIARKRSELNAIQRTWYPEFSLQGVAAARGTGMEINGDRMGGLNGLAPTVQNYGVGLSITFPLMDRFAIEQQQAEQMANVRAGQAQYEVIAANLRNQFNAALESMSGARRIATNTPVEVSSGRAALAQSTARYRSGLAPIDDVAQAERLLVQAQIDDALARLSVWRSLLQVDAARGDIQPFLTQASQ